ncbi:MAG: isoprenylcysteine carboxylmethyltransferase family protein [Candidatus Riflebacteria bacterium]|nr:isoprenylcysteine carboxylmethyltransferase family protein [Candidatus Riflebacteria bacterium]
MRRDLGAFFFRYRDLLPIPLAIAMLARAKPRLVGWLAGLPLIILGEMIRIWALCHIGPTTRTREICADVLVTSGPYQYTRNPLYFANLLKISGFISIAGDPWIALITLFFYGIEFLTVISYEEHFLAEKFPEVFMHYAKTVPTFFPNGRKHSSESTTAAWSLRQAIFSERRTFVSTGLLLAMLGFRNPIWKIKDKGSDS